MKKNVINAFLASLVLVTPLYAFTFTDDPTFGIPTSSNTGTFNYGFVGNVDDNGALRRINASITIVSSTFTNIDGVNGIATNNQGELTNVGTVGFQLDNRGAGANTDPFLVATLSFTFADGPNEGNAATISNLFATGFDIDSSLSLNSGTGNYSDLVGISRADFSGGFLTDTTLLEFGEREVDMVTFDIAELAADDNTAQGNSNPNETPSNILGDATSANPLDFAATFALEEDSSFTLLYGITGPDSNARSNRNINFTFTTQSAIIPEPSSLTLLGLASISFLLRRRR